jgi:hypothetical protein
MRLALHSLSHSGFGAEPGQMRYACGGLNAECSNEVAAGSVAALRHFSRPSSHFTTSLDAAGIVPSGPQFAVLPIPIRY